MAKCAKPSIRTFALGGEIDTYGNNLTRSNQMGAADDAMRARRLATPSGLQSTRVGAVTQNNLQQNQLATLNNQISMGTAAENANLTMSEKAALGMGTTSADASALRTRTAALSTLRDGLAAQQQDGNESAWMGGGTGDPMNSSWSNGLRSFAEGGKIDADELMRRMAAKYGTSGATAAPVESAPTPAVPVQQPQKTLGGLVGMLKGRQAQIDKAAGYANGGKIQGPGTPTSDSIPAEVKQTGEPIKVSTGERIVSAQQEQILQKIAQGLGFDSLDALLEKGTGKPVGPTIKGDSPKRGFVYGGKPLPEQSNTELAPYAHSQSINGAPPLVPLSGENLTPMQAYNVKPLTVDFSPSAKAQANVRQVKDAVMKTTGRNIGSESSQAVGDLSPQPAYTEGAQERTFPRSSGTPVAPATPAQPQTIGSLTMGGKTRTLASMASGSNGYVDAQGKPVAKWEDTARYAEAMGVNKRMSDLATKMERDRYGRDMQADITNPRVHALAQTNLERMDKEDANIRSGHLAEQQGISAGLDQQLKRNTLEKSNQEKQLLARMNDPNLTPEQRLALRSDLLAMNGKNPNEHRFYVGEDEETDVSGARKKTARLLDALSPGGRIDGAGQTLPAPKSEAEMKALPKGTRYTAPDGSVRVKP